MLKLKTITLEMSTYDCKKTGNSSILESLTCSIEIPHKVLFSGIKSINWWRYKLHDYIKQLEEIELNTLTGIYPSKLLPGRGMCIPVSIVREFNLFDEKFPQYASDDDYCLRAAERGYAIYVSWNTVIYTHLNTSGIGTSYINHSFQSYLKGF